MRLELKNKPEREFLLMKDLKEGDIAEVIENGYKGKIIKIIGIKGILYAFQLSGIDYWTDIKNIHLEVRKLKTGETLVVQE